MAETGTLVTPEQLPDWSKEWPGEPSVRFPLRATPKPFVRLMAGGSNQSFRIRSVAVPEWEQASKGRIKFVTSALSVAAPASLVRTRALGAPLVKTTLFVTGLAHSRGIGTIIVTPGSVHMTSLVRTRELGTPAIAGGSQPEPYRNWHRSLRGARRMDEQD